MKNPWIDLKKKAPYVLDIDEQWVLDYGNRLQKKAQRIDDNKRKEQLLYDFRLRTENIPFPYYGNPVNARVVVLQANPGHDPLFSQLLHKEELLDQDYKNLFHLHQPGIYSMVPENREWHYVNGAKGTCWYWQRTKGLREAVGWERVAGGIMYMEMFPYRSMKLMYPKYLPPSQQYTPPTYCPRGRQPREVVNSSIFC